jgi:hypothetical protein
MSTVPKGVVDTATAVARFTTKMLHGSDRETYYDINTGAVYRDGLAHWLHAYDHYRQKLIARGQFHGETEAGWYSLRDYMVRRDG